MRILLKLAFLLALMPVISTAEEIPQPPEGYYITRLFVCTDNENGQTGICMFGKDTAGNVYETFWQNDVLMSFRKVVGDGYITLYTNPKFNSI